MALCALLLAALAPAQVGGQWTALYTYDGESAYDNLGTSVANVGDVNADGINDLLLGAPHANPNGLNDAGSAWLYSGLDGSLIYRLDGVHAGDQFGIAVGPAGDATGDGIPDLIVGAIFEKVGISAAAGTATIFDGATGTVYRQLQGTQRWGIFGQSVNTAYDIDGDGIDDQLIGEPYAEPNGWYRAGSAYAFSGATGAQIYRWDSPSADWWFGNAVAPAGDANGDGVPDILIGATFADLHPNEMNHGLALLISGATGSILATVPGVNPGDMTGISVCGMGDLNADGLDDFAVGAWLAKPNQTVGAGAVYVMSATGDLIRREVGDHIWEKNGWSIASAGDLDQDGVNDLLSGAFRADDAGIPEAGKVYIYSGRTGETLTSFHGLNPGDRMGYCVAGAGDLNGDGYPEQVLSIHRKEINGMAEAGQVLVETYDPLVSVDIHQISSSVGGTATMSIDFPDSEAGFSYTVLASATGRGPTTLGGVAVPLTPDSLYQRMRSGSPPPFLQNTSGTLDVSGNAKSEVVCAPGGMAPLIGRTLFLAAISHTQPNVVRMSTAAVGIDILP